MSFKIKLRSLLILGLLGAMSVSAQTNIEYMPKALVKELQSGEVATMPAMEELVVPDSLCKSAFIKGKYFRLTHSEGSKYQYIYVGRVNSCRTGGCSISSNYSSKGESEYFDYFILFDRAKTVRLVKVFNYKATHGQEITAKGWLKQFIGHNYAGSLKVNKNIDAISGATISVYAITLDIEIKTSLLHKMR